MVESRKLQIDGAVYGALYNYPFESDRFQKGITMANYLIEAGLEHEECGRVLESIQQRIGQVDPMLQFRVSTEGVTVELCEMERSILQQTVFFLEQDRPALPVEDETDDKAKREKLPDDD